MEKYFYLIRSPGLCEYASIFQELFFLELLLLSEEFCFQIYQLQQQQNKPINNQDTSPTFYTSVTVINNCISS